MDKLKLYKFKITEILQREELIVAINKDDALRQLHKKYNNEEVVLNAEDFVSVGFEYIEK